MKKKTKTLIWIILIVATLLLFGYLGFKLDLFSIWSNPFPEEGSILFMPSTNQYFYLSDLSMVGVRQNGIRTGYMIFNLSKYSLLPLEKITKIELVVDINSAYINSPACSNYPETDSGTMLQITGRQLGYQDYATHPTTQLQMQSLNSGISSWNIYDRRRLGTYYGSGQVINLYQYGSHETSAANDTLRVLNDPLIEELIIGFSITGSALNDLPEDCYISFGNGVSRGEIRISGNICNTPADTNCDGIVDRSEITAYIIKWLNNQISRSELGQGIQAWAIS